MTSARHYCVFHPVMCALAKAVALSLVLMVVSTDCTIGGRGGAAYAAAVEFAYRVIDFDPPSGSSCCLDVCGVGDIDGDGLDDVMVGSENSVGVVWYHAPDWTRYTIGSGSFTTDGEVVDLDGDGDEDVVISCISRRQVEWWENTGNPFNPSSWTRHNIGSDFCHDLAAGDIDGDGDVDVTIFRKNSEVVWFQAPSDPRNSWIRRSIASTSGEGLDVGDIDGDGDRDVAASRWWYENYGATGTNWIKHTITNNWSDDCRDIIADMDGDGDKDVVLTHSEGSGRVAWFENPAWTEHTIEPNNLTGAHSLEVDDFDFDGDMDVLTGEMHTSPQDRVLVYGNTGGGLTWEKTILATTGTHNARLGDVNGDLKPDIVGKNYSSSKKVEVWINTNDFAVGAAESPPAPFELLGNSPNPFTRHTTIQFRMDAPARVLLSVFDVRGRLVSTLVDGWRDVGHHAVAWDGRTASGRQARAGVFFYRLEAGGMSSASTVQTQKLVLMK
jgi:hypothetical protein